MAITVSRLPEVISKLKDAEKMKWRQSKMGTWIKSGNTMIGYQMIPERKKPVFGIMKGNQFVVYGQFHDKQSAEQFMESLKIFFNIEENKNEVT